MFCSKCGKKLSVDGCPKCNKENVSNSKYFYDIVNSTSFYVVNLIYFTIGFLYCLIVLDKILSNNLVILISIFISIIATIFNLTTELLLVKAKFPWWGAFVPIYNQYLSSKLIFKNGTIFLITYIPTILSFINIYLVLMKIIDLTTIINIINYVIIIVYLILSCYMLGKRFGINIWLVIFFPYIALPIVAFSKKYQYIYINYFNKKLEYN